MSPDHPTALQPGQQNETLSQRKKDTEMANKYMKRRSAALTTRKMQIKSMMRCHLKPVGVGEDMEKRELLPTVSGNVD